MDSHNTMDSHIHTLLTTDSHEPFEATEVKEKVYVKQYYDKIFKTERTFVTEEKLVWIKENGVRSLQMRKQTSEKTIPYKKDMSAYRGCIYEIKEAVRGEIRKVFWNERWTATKLVEIWNTRIVRLSNWVEMVFSVLDTLREENDISVDEIVPNEFFRECIYPNLLGYTIAARKESLESFYIWIKFLNNPCFVWNDAYMVNIHLSLHPFLEEEYKKLGTCKDICEALKQVDEWAEFRKLIRSEAAKENILQNVAKNLWNASFMETVQNVLERAPTMSIIEQKALDILLTLATHEQHTTIIKALETHIEKTVKVHEETMETVVKMYLEYYEFIMIMKAPQNQACFQKALQTAYRHLLKDAVLERFVIFMDHMLRTVEYTYSITMLTIIQIMFHCIEDKDMFVKLYQQRMIRRLIYLSENPENKMLKEKQMLFSARIEFGGNIVRPLELLFDELAVKKPLYISESDYLRTINMAACNTQAVLSVPDWKIPAVLQPLAEVMKKRTDKHRRLTWLPAHDSITLKTMFNDKWYQLTMTSIQASVLFLFDTLGKSSITKEEIEEHTGMREPATSSVLQSLVHVKVPLLIKNQGKNEDKDSYELVETLQTPHYSVNILPPQVVVKQEAILENVELNREYAIDANIVMVMKREKRCKFIDIHSKVSQQVSHIFVPTVQDVKKRLESLIDRDYIERDSADPLILIYVP